MTNIHQDFPQRAGLLLVLDAELEVESIQPMEVPHLSMDSVVSILLLFVVSIIYSYRLLHTRVALSSIPAENRNA